MIGDEVSCLKNVGSKQLKEANSYCHLLNARQILPRSKQESDDLVPALLSMNLVSEGGKTVVSIDIYNSTEGWYDSAGQLVSYFNWLQNEPDDLSGKQNYAGLLIDETNKSIGWADYSSTNELNVVCMKPTGNGKNNSLLRLNRNWW